MVNFSDLKYSDICSVLCILAAVVYESDTGVLLTFCFFTADVIELLTVSTRNCSPVKFCTRIE